MLSTQPHTSSASVPALLQKIKQQLGATPSLYLGSDEPGSSRVDALTRKRISFAVAAVNGCTYCPNTFVYLGKNQTPADHGEMGPPSGAADESTDPAVRAAVSFAVKIARARGHVSEVDVQQVRSAGYDDQQVLEIVTHVAVSTMNDYLNSYGEGAWG